MAILTAERERYNNIFGIFIGIETFPSSRGEIKNLFHANQDAKKMYDFFLKEVNLKNGRMNFVCLLTNPS